jgi:sodium/potassium-transporting ATPase subunit beta
MTQPAPKQKQSCSSRLSSFATAICNWEEKKFLGRTASSWAKIGIFYLIYYACLAGFFAIMLAGLFSTIDPKAPTQQNMYSLIKANPGMGFRPRVIEESTLIRYDSMKNETFLEHIRDIKKVLDEYTIENGTNVVDCDNSERASEQVCLFDMNKLGSECTEENGYGYNDGKPCILLKINKVYNFMPTAFENKTDDEHEQKARAILGDRFKENHIGISCEGENPADVDNLGPPQYYPQQGLSFDFFPYLNQENYKAPLVFVQFPEVTKGPVIQVWCKLWAKNIKHHKNDKAGSVHFELLVDKSS